MRTRLLHSRSSDVTTILDVEEVWQQVAKKLGLIEKDIGKEILVTSHWLENKIKEVNPIIRQTKREIWSKSNKTTYISSVMKLG